MPIFFIFTLFISTSLFALVSIAPVDIGSKPGFGGNVSGSLSSKSGNTDKKDYSLGIRMQYDQASDYLAWGTFTYNYGISSGAKNEDKKYAHIRYIHAIDTSDWCSEFFIQSEQDKFKDINTRSLGGGGLRWRFFNDDEWGKGYLGVGGLFEKIDYAHPDINTAENNKRLNSYLAYTKNFSTASKLSYIGYFQPKLDQGSDYVSSQAVELIVPIYGKLNLSLSAKYLFDSRPAVSVEKKDVAYLTNLFWEF
ncbi:MAG: DUF481 domain-containing protein [Sulfuricurvum sp.]|nr:DUF481 domain-containing protein [Sulfuricurvum sp.]